MEHEKQEMKANYEKDISEYKHQMSEYICNI